MALIPWLDSLFTFKLWPYIPEQIEGLTVFLSELFSIESLSVTPENASLQRPEVRIWFNTSQRLPS